MSDCILWEGSRKGQGYGQGRTDYAHREAYREAYGEIPEGYHVHHICGVKLCVNPEHLVAVSRTSHAAEHRPTHCKNGHEFTPENTYEHGGARHCRTCRREASLRFSPPSGRPPGRPRGTHCARGHEFTPENTGFTSGRRFCRICRAESRRAWQESESGQASREKRNATRRAQRVRS